MVNTKYISARYCLITEGSKVILKYNCEKISEDNPDDYLQNYYIGALNGNLGLYDLALRKYWPASRKGKKGKDNLQKTIEKFE